MVLNAQNPCLHSQLLMHIVVVLDLMFGVNGHCDVRFRLFLLFFFKTQKIHRCQKAHPSCTFFSSNVQQIQHSNISLNLLQPSWHIQTPGLVHWLLQRCRLGHGSGTAPEAPGLSAPGKMCSYSGLLLQSSSLTCQGGLAWPPLCNPTQLNLRRSWDLSRTGPGTEWTAGTQQVGMQAGQAGLWRNWRNIYQNTRHKTTGFFWGSLRS